MWQLDMNYHSVKNIQMAEKIYSLVFHEASLPK